MSEAVIQSPSQPAQSVVESVAQVVTNSTLAQQIQNITSTLSQTVDESSGFGLLPLVIGAVVLAIILYFLLGKKKTGNQNVLALIGERNSGKTQLWIRLNGGKLFESVPSIKNNLTSYKSARKTFQFIDYCGDGISKDQILNPQNYPNIHTLIQTLDGTDSTKLGDAALFMYRLLVSKAYQKQECNYILFLNKADSENFLTKAKIVKRLQDQIQHIKQSRKNSPEEAEDEEDYLKTTKERFDLAKTGIRIVVGSAKNNELKELEAVLQDVL